MFIDLDVIFNEFINVIQENNKYIIGLLNTKLDVIFCSDGKYVGKHFAHVSNDTHNIFYQIKVKDYDYGYLWISGHDDSLKMISGLLFDSLTTRILFEHNEKMLSHKVTKDDALVKLLLEQDYRSNEVLALASELGVKTHVLRVALLVVSEKGFSNDEIVRLKLRENDKQLLFSLIDKYNFLIYKDIESVDHQFELKRPLNKYIHELQEWGLIDCKFFVGSIQRKFSAYRSSYEHALWLKEQGYGVLNQPTYFDSVSQEYFFSLIKDEDIESVYDVYYHQSKGLRRDEMIEIADRLIANDYNITRTAEDLFLHKNTLIYKLKKYEELFDIDIRNSFRGKIMFALVTKALKERLRKQEGES